MGSCNRTPIDESTVIQLLRLRRELYADEAECPGLLGVALMVSGQAGPAERRAAMAHIQTCPDCAATVLEYPHALAEREQPAKALHFRRPRPDRPALAGPLHHRAPWVPLAVAATLLVCVAALLRLWFPATPPDGSRGGLALKGGSDAIFVAVQRADTQFQLRPGDRLVEGDRIGLFYSTALRGFLAVYSLDATGRVGLLYPAGRTVTAAIGPADKRPLSDGGIVRGGLGCEWIVAVFSHVPLSTQALAAELQAAGRQDVPQGADCTLQIFVPAARTTLVIPAMR